MWEETPGKSPAQHLCLREQGQVKDNHQGRQQARESERSLPQRPGDRGWMREELYTRGGTHRHECPVYRFDPRFPEKQRIANDLFVAAVTRPIVDSEPLLARAEALREAEELLAELKVLHPDEELLRIALRVPPPIRCRGSMRTLGLCGALWSSRAALGGLSARAPLRHGSGH